MVRYKIHLLLSYWLDILVQIFKRKIPLSFKTDVSAKLKSDQFVTFVIYQHVVFTSQKVINFQTRRDVFCGAVFNDCLADHVPL